MRFFSLLKKADGHYHIKIIPSDAADIRSFNISHNRIRRLIAGSLVLLLLIIAWTVFLVLEPDYGAQNSDLIRKNVKLNGELDSIRNKVAVLENNLERIERFDRKLRAITDFADNHRKVGIGPLSEGEIIASERIGFGGANESFALKLEEKLGALNSIGLDKEVDRLLELSQERESELAELTNFLEDQKLLLSHVPSIWPADGWVTSGFGYRRSPFTSYRKFHDGIDIANNIGTPVYAPADGTVIYTGSRDAYGRTMVVNHGFGLTTRYAHCSIFDKKVGDHVKRGEKIATIGNTGRSTGPHLHYEVRLDNIPQNPRRYILE